jgi:hypothetical protein
LKLAFGILLWAAAAAAGAVEIAGAVFDERMQVGSEETLLNGAGLRKILFFKAYAIGLYLPQRHATVAEVLAERGARRLRIVLMRDLDADQIVNTIDVGLHRNLSDAEFLPLTKRVDILRNAILAIGEAKQGSVIHLDWIPQNGVTRLSVNAERKGADIPGEDFFQALLKVWLGPKVNDPSLRERLLGKDHG